MPRFGFLCFALLTLFQGSCSLFSEMEDELWVHEIVQDAPPLRDLLSECEWALLEADLPPGDRDEAAARVTSGWKTVMHPFSTGGRRYQGILEIEPTDEIGVYRVSSRFRVQANKEIHKPLDESLAKWESMEDDEQRAKILLYHLLGRVKIPGPSDDFYRRKPWRNALDQ